VKSVQAHYREHLGPVYDWSMGDFEQASARAEAQLLAAGLGPGGGALAVDLGCGSGRQSVPLLRLGYRVLAIDTCSILLQALKARARGLPLRAIEEDLRGFRRHVAEPAAAIVCMGDVLIHLESREDVRALLGDAARSLAPDGKLVLGFRDLTSLPTRFVPVRSDDARILTCVLDEQGQFVVVNDILHERHETGWRMSVSSYRKLRLSPQEVRADALSAGLQVTSLSSERGLVTIVAGRAIHPGQRVGAPSDEA
jgi:SAM-dependent methyltransferase